MRRSIAVALALFAVVGLNAQTAIDLETLPAFEAASIRRNLAPDSNARPVSRFTPGRYVATATTLRDLIRTAFGLSVATQIRGGPQWIASTRFDVQAVAKEVSQERMRLMLRRLLVERFGLKVRVVTEVVPVFALTLKPGDRTRKLAPQINTCLQQVGQLSAVTLRKAITA
jgi:uncharacterized protein (TIGR03435 family)